MAYVNVHVDDRDILEGMDTDDLLDELKRRGKDYNTQFVDGEEMRFVLETLYEKRRIGKDYQSELDKLIYDILGKIV